MATWKELTSDDKLVYVNLDAVAFMKGSSKGTHLIFAGDNDQVLAVKETLDDIFNARGPKI